jgi:hypothetical protein
MKNKTKQQSFIKQTFLDEKIIQNFRNIINSTRIFNNLIKHKNRYNLICAVIDRINSAVIYLNQHSAHPKSEEEFIFFLVYSCILKDGIYKLYENVFHKLPTLQGEKRYFINASNYFDPIFDENTCPNDDMFFEYLRSVTFAHPFDTKFRNRPFLKNGESQCSPWVIVNSMFSNFGKDDAVGVRVYSNIEERDLYDIQISFTAVKEYIKARYLCLIELMEWAKSEVIEQNNQWKATKVFRSENPIETVKSIKEILCSRFENIYLISVVEKYLFCELTCQSNLENVSKYRNAIIATLSRICDCVDNLDYESLDKELSILYVTPKKMHPHAHYQLEKIFCYLIQRSENIEPDSDEEWGLIQANAFSQHFAKKWVYIDVKTMSYDEIHLLVSTACYLEALEQLK